jgi:hypothetical protein
LPFLANWPVTSGWLTIDPIYWTSGLGVDLQPGPLAPPPPFDPHSGWTFEALGRLAANEWLSGRIPWWNPYSGPGLPLAAEGQNPSLFLPLVFLLALPNGLFLLALVLQEIAAFATFALLRCMGLGRAASWAGAAFYCLNGTFAWFADSAIMPIAFAPLLLLGIEMEWKAAVEQTPSVGWIIAAVAVAVSLYAAFPETAYIDGLLGVVWAAQRFAVLARRGRFQFARRIAGAAALGVLLAAPYVIPFAQLLIVGDIGYHVAGLRFKAPADALAVLTMPYVLGPHGRYEVTDKLFWIWGYVGGYVPIPQLLVAVTALLCPRVPHRGLRFVLTAWIATTLAATFGVPGLTEAVYAIPALAETLVFRYAPPSWELALALLTAMGIDDWQKGRVERRLAIDSAIAAGLAAALSLAAAWHTVTSLLETVDSYVWWLVTSVATAAATGFAVTACISAAPTRRRLGAVLGSLAGYALLLFTIARLSGLRAADIDKPAVAFLRAELGLQRFYAMGPLRPNYGAFFGIASLNSIYIPNPQIWSDYIAGTLDTKSPPSPFPFTGTWPPQSERITQFEQHLPAFAALGVRYVVVPADAPAFGDPRLPLRMAYEDGLMRIFEIETAAPYFEAVDGECRVSQQSRELVITECKRPARLIRRELFFDGWRATLNGRSVDIRQEGIVQAVEVPAGRVTIAFRYAPPYATLSACLALLSVCILVVGSVRTTRIRNIAH